MAIHDSTCWFCGDGSQDEDEECDAGQVDACDAAPCANGGTCHTAQQTVSSYQCQCTEAYEGATCETETNPLALCSSDENNCDIHATCRHTGAGQHSCECFLGYAGDGQLCAEQGGGALPGGLHARAAVPFAGAAGGGDDRVQQRPGVPDNSYLHLRRKRRAAN